MKQFKKNFELVIIIFLRNILAKHIDKLLSKFWNKIMCIFTVRATEREYGQPWLL